MKEWKNMKITPETHKLLEEMKIELTPKLKDPNLTFDKVIAYLINLYKETKIKA
jgi:hypothetical protein